MQSEISTEQVCQILGMLNRHSYEPRKTLFREGEPNTHLYLIRDGQLKLTTTNTDGREQIIGLAVAGHIIGFDSMEDKIYTYNAEAIAPVAACKIQHKNMLRILKQNPHVSMRIVEILNEELSQAKNLIRILGQKSSVERIATFILSLLPRRGPVPEELLFPLSREEMGKMIGLRVETVSRVMADLQRKKVIEAPRGNIRILDIKKLTSFTGLALPRTWKKNGASRGSAWA